jgi:hypothetical protein
LRRREEEEKGVKRNRRIRQKMREENVGENLYWKKERNRKGGK